MLLLYINFVARISRSSLSSKAVNPNLYCCWITVYFFTKRWNKPGFSGHITPHPHMLIGPRILKSLNSIEKTQPMMMIVTFNGNPNATIISCDSPTNCGVVCWMMLLSQFMLVHYWKANKVNDVKRRGQKNIQNKVIQTKINLYINKYIKKKHYKTLRIF